LYNQAYLGKPVAFPSTFNREKRTDSDKFVLRKLPCVHVKLLPQANWTEVMKQYIYKGATA
jgi:hypothetical protein